MTDLDHLEEQCRKYLDISCMNIFGNIFYFLIFFLFRIEGVCGRWGEGSQSPSGREQF